MSDPSPGWGWSDGVPAEVRLRSLRQMHQRSIFPATTGEHRGQHYCLHCTTSVDDFTLYAVWPCKTALFAGAVRVGQSDEPEVR